MSFLSVPISSISLLFQEQWSIDFSNLLFLSMFIFLWLSNEPEVTSIPEFSQKKTFLLIDHKRADSEQMSVV
jgi:hypothetical protein